MILQSYRSIGLDGNLCDIYGLAHAIAHVFDGLAKGRATSSTHLRDEETARQGE
jgi:hypothetical protein